MAEWAILANHLEGRPSSFWLYTAMLNFSEANWIGWANWPLTTLAATPRNAVATGLRKSEEQIFALILQASIGKVDICPA